MTKFRYKGKKYDFSYGPRNGNKVYGDCDLSNFDFTRIKNLGSRSLINDFGPTLDNCNLSRANFESFKGHDFFYLKNCDLQNANFVNSSMRIIENSNLRGASFAGAKIHVVQGCDFAGVDLRGAVIEFADSSSFVGASLAGATIYGASNSNFSSLDLSETGLTGRFQGCDFSGAQVTSKIIPNMYDSAIRVGNDWQADDCNFTGARIQVKEFGRGYPSNYFLYTGFGDLPTKGWLKNCRFVNADLSGSEFCFVDFSNSDFSDARMDDVKFFYCDLKIARIYGADLSNAIFVETNINAAIRDQNTGLPKNSQPVEAVLTIDKADFDTETFKGRQEYWAADEASIAADVKPEWLIRAERLKRERDQARINKGYKTLGRSWDIAPKALKRWEELERGRHVWELDQWVAARRALAEYLWEQQFWPFYMQHWPSRPDYQEPMSGGLIVPDHKNILKELAECEIAAEMHRRENLNAVEDSKDSDDVMGSSQSLIEPDENSSFPSCVACGNTVASEANFCPKCGVPLTS
jgi:uncharacterized protein YjbI with pentapeptide repeats